MPDFKVLYSFQSETQGEINASEGEIVELIYDAGDGWYEVRKKNGSTGYLPESYVTSYDEPVQSPLPLTSVAGDTPNEWDDDFPSDDSAGEQPPSNKVDASSTSLSTIHSTGKAVGSDSARTSVLRKYFTRQFLNAGGEDVLLQANLPNDVPCEATVVLVNNKYQWQRSGEETQCSITSTQKGGKLRGLKKYISYELYSMNSKTVLRRYKRFDWLHTCLISKFPCIIIPSLPDKSLTGRFDEHFIEERQAGLQQWLNRMCKHPVVSKSTIFQHFLTCSDEKKWKNGKRKGEADPYQNARFYLTVKCPDPVNLQDLTLKDTENLHKEQIDLQRAFRVLGSIFTHFNDDYVKRRKECISMASAFSTCHSVCSKAYGSAETRFPSALGYAAETFTSMKTEFLMQSSATVAAIAFLHEFTNMFAALPPKLELIKSAFGAVEEASRLSKEGKLSGEDANSLRTAVVKMGRVTQAEKNLLMDQLQLEGSAAMADYMRNQAACLRRMAEQLDLSAAQFCSQ